MKELPKKAELIQLTHVKIDKHAGKVCKCNNSPKIINPDNKTVYCEVCGAQMDPFDALLSITRWINAKNSSVKKLLAQAEYLKDFIEQAEKEKRRGL